MIFTSLSPNTETDDVRRAFGLLFMPWKWKAGPAVSELEKAFKTRFGFSHTYAFLNGRTSLFAILKAYGITEGDEVLVQAYTCVAVPEPVLWLGAKAVFVDVGADLNMDPEDLRKKITSKTKTIVIQHTLGNPAKLDELLTIARERNIFVIEDCAHALGAEYKGKKVGTFGDASFFSFGRDKVISSVFGGMVAVKDENLAKKIEALQNSFSYPSCSWIKRQLLHPLILTASKATYNFLGLGKIIITICRKTHLISLAVQKIELKGGKPTFAFKKMPNALAILALAQLEKLERYNEHRRKIAAIYERELVSSEIKMPLTNPESKNIYLRFAIFIEDPYKLSVFAKQKGFELGSWYNESIVPDGADLSAIGYAPCENAELLASHSCNLPAGIQVTEDDARKVVEVVKEYLATQ